MDSLPRLDRTQGYDLSSEGLHARTKEDDIDEAKNLSPVISDKDSEENPSTPIEDDSIPWAVKWISLIAIMTMPIGVNWADSALGPLKNTLRNEMGITNEQFGVISSADAIVNSIWPLIGGILLDWAGVEVVTPICTTVILLGSLVSASGVQIGNWRLLAGGYILQGFGTALLDSCQQVFFHAFGRRQGLAFAFGLESAIASATSLASEAAAIPIRDSLGTRFVFWIPVAFCGFSSAVNFAYLYYARKYIPSRYRPSTGRQRVLAQGGDAKTAARKLISLESLWLLPWCFWMLPATQLLQSGAAGGFSVARADIIRMKGYTEATAGFLQSGATAIQVVLAPVFGYVIDRWCHRFHYVALAPLLWITSCALLGFTDVHPILALVIASLAGVINSSPLQMALHLLVADHRLIGTAFGVWRAFNNSGSVVMDVSYGRIQDRTPGEGYDQVLKTTIGIKSLAFALGLIYILVDYRYLGAGLTMTRKKRDAVEKTILVEDRETHPITRRTPIKWVTVGCMCLLAGFVLTAWVLFFLGFAS